MSNRLAQRVSDRLDTQKKTTRHIVALDYLRAFIIVVVLAHHSVIAYSYSSHFDPKHYLWGAPIVDSKRWLGFDLFILFNDIFFMSLMFFLSGLFVWSSLARKGGRAFLRDRSLRLGLPFMLAVIFLMPLAYYPSFRMTGADPGFFAFWQQCLSFDNWPCGPIWFIWMLLAFDCVAAGLHKIAPRSGDALGRMTSFAVGRPAAFFAVLMAISAAAYLPMLVGFGPARWFVLGPFSIQASRLLLYAVYFFAGVGIGAYDIEQGLLARDGRLVQRWALWLFAAIAAYALVVTLRVVGLQMASATPSLTTLLIYSLASLLSCGATGFAMLGLFLRFANERARVFDSLANNAYGMFLIHYVFVIWLQYALLEATLSATEKGAIVFVGALVISWCLTAAMRCIPGVAKII